MKKILMISLLFSLTVGFVACDDNKDEYLSDYSTIVYFRNSGEIPLTSDPSASPCSTVSVT